jgi:uncharacterized membrane protein
MANSEVIMEGFFLFVAIVLIIVVLAIVVNTGSTIRLIKLELNILSQRLDFLRKELDKAGVRPQPPIIRKPAIPELPDESVLPQPPPIHAAGDVELKKGEPASYPFVIAPEPSPQEKEAWMFEEPEPAEKSKFVESAQEILRKMWSWILFGADEKPKNVTTEYALASTWLPRLAVILLVMGIGFILKLSIKHLDEQGIVAVCVVAGVVMLFSGKQLLGKKYKVIGQVLLGGGLLVLYLSAYAAGPYYRLFGEFSMSTAFALMILVTVTAGILAVGSDSLLIAIIGIAGGYFTPVMLKTDAPNLPGLYSYVLVLSLGILGIAHKKQWRLLNYLGFVLTYGLFCASIRSGGYERADFPIAMAFLSAYFAIYSSIVYFYNIVKGGKSTILEIVHLVANGMIFSYLGYNLIYGAHGRLYPAVMSVGLAVFYIAHVFIFLRNKLVDRQLLISLIALAGFFTTWTLPLLLEGEHLTVALALVALMFLWLGMKLRSNFLQHAGYAVYVILFVRLLFVDIGRDFHSGPPSALQMAVYWHEMFKRLLTFGTSIASIAGAFLLQLKRPDPIDKFAIEDNNDTPEVIDDGVARNVLYWFGLLFAFLFIHLELNTMFYVCCQPVRLPVLTMLWCAMGIYFFWNCLRREGMVPIMFPAMCVFLVGALVKVFAVDLWSWRICDRFIYDMEYNFLYAGMRLLDFGLIITMLIAVWWLAKRRETLPAPVFGYAALIILFLYTTLEINSLLFWKLPGFQQGGVSVLWAVFTIAFIAGGIWKSIKPLRYSGLLLVAIVVGKIFLVDLGKMSVIYKALALVAVSGFLLLGSFAYIRSDRSFLRKIGETKDEK